MQTTMKVASQRIFYGVAIFIMAIALVLPAIASAAQVTSRSVALSSSSADADDVTYTVNFTPVRSAGAFVVDFCANTPLIGQACTPAEGFSAAGAATSAAGFTVASATDDRVVVTGAMTAAPVTVELTGIDNPTAAGTLYARIVTFVDGAAATASTATEPTGAIDEGAVAIAITDSIGVSGVVLETLTFCVSGEVINADCASTTAPTVALGDIVPGDEQFTVMTPGQLEQGSVYTQVTTNAVNGVIVRLKSNAAQCGGLIRAGDAAGQCHIKPADAETTGIGVDAANNLALFGVKTASAASTSAPGAQNPNGTLVPAGIYGETNYRMNYVDGDATGVTSTFGDTFMGTSGKPASNQNMQLDFAATVSNNTPAGAYSADISLIAVGTF